jgi:hypothetical protein
MSEGLRHLRIFLASPGDVQAERQIALDVIRQIQFEPHLRGKVYLEPVAWDQPGAGAVMRATVSPQEAIAEGLPTPADCDIVIVIFWARMGTPLPNPPYRKANGDPYESGTEWEYENAMHSARQHKRPEVVVYRRAEKVPVDPDAPDSKSRDEQHQRVKRFFARFRDPKTGAILSGWNEYQTPSDFAGLFALHLKQLIEKLRNVPAAPMPDSRVPDRRRQLPSWRGSLYPGPISATRLRLYLAARRFGSLWKRQRLLGVLRYWPFVALLASLWAASVIFQSRIGVPQQHVWVQAEALDGPLADLIHNWHRIALVGAYAFKTSVAMWILSFEFKVFRKAAKNGNDGAGCFISWLLLLQAAAAWSWLVFRANQDLWRYLLELGNHGPLLNVQAIAGWSVLVAALLRLVFVAISGLAKLVRWAYDLD